MNRDRILQLARESELDRQLSMEVPFVVDRLERFAALIEAEVRGDAEPTLYQRRIKPVFDSKFPWSDWKECSKEVFDQFEKQQVWGDYIYEVRRLYLHPAPAVDAEPDANRYRWLKENSARISWNPARFNEHIVDGFAAFGTGYLGYSFEQAIDLAMQAGDSND